MRIYKVILPLAILLIGVGVGRYFGHQEVAPQVKALEAISVTPLGSTKSLNMLKAPQGGFDSAFVKVTQVTATTVPDTISISGKLAFDAEHMHLVSSRVAGRLDRIVVFEGASVQAGQVVAELYSAEWLSAQYEYLLARNTVQTLAATSQQTLLADASATLQAAADRMKILGASDVDVAHLESTGRVQSHLNLRAPINGVVIKRNMEPGAFLNMGDNLMTVADMRHIWFVGNIYEQDYDKVKLGQSLVFQSQALPGKTFAGKVNFIGTSVDSTTHTLPIRCSVANLSGELRPELFGSASLTTGHHMAVIVPPSAIVRDQQNTFVVVEEQEGGQYRRVVVSSVVLSDGQVIVNKGLAGGERIVVEGATLVNAAMLGS